jgi:3-methyladenine DNA glycosylase/8-oxoguanine DNA glycosylase
VPPDYTDAIMLATTYAPAERVDLASTLRPLRRGAGDPTFQTGPDGVWRTIRTPSGAATVHLRPGRHGVDATAWGPGAEWAIAGVPALLGAGDDWSGLDVTPSAFLADSRHRNPGLRLARTERVLEAMVPAILEQKVTGHEARSAWRSLLRRYAEPAPGPAPAGMLVFPPADVWRRIPSWVWHRAGVGPDRSATIVRAARVADSLERTLQHGRGGDRIDRALRSIPGVGVWTAAETTQRAHGDPDSPSVGDYHLPALVGWALIGRPVDDDGMLELLAPYAGHRQRVMRLIESSGFAKPRFGPRMTIQDHRAH